MSGKNDRFILGGLIAIAVIAVIGAAAVYGIGAYVYINDQTASPTPTPTPAPTPTVAPTPTAIPASAQDPFSVDRVISDKGARTYTVIVSLAQGSAPVDMTNMTAEIVADGNTYPAWDYLHSEYYWSAGSNGDMILDGGETFTFVIYAPQAGVPLGITTPTQLVLLYDGVSESTIYVTAV